MKFLIADFKIEKYGGIVEHVSAKIKALKSLGHEVDLVQFVPSSITQNAYNNKVAKFESGEFNAQRIFNSEYKGYEYDEAIGYWKNNYFGYVLPPSNRFNVFDDGVVERWYEFTKDVDVIMWNFMPTKNNMWKRGGKTVVGFDHWWQFFDLPSHIKQTFIVHDAYFDVRASHVSALREKITLLECAHVAAYSCCEHIAIPRTLLLNPRYIPDNYSEKKLCGMRERSVDFFAAPGFKPMKRMEDFVQAMKHIDKHKYSNLVAGAGINQMFMASPDKCKKEFYISEKNDPDAPKETIGRRMWDVAIENGMNYVGMLSGEEMNVCFQNSRFAIDPSFSKHYADYCRTHFNGFIIEAMLNGCYPVLKDYRGLSKKSITVCDPLFDCIEALYVPWDATPKQFAEALMSLKDNMTPKQFVRATRKNFNTVCELFNAKKNIAELIEIIENPDAAELEVGIDSDNVKKITKDIMTGFFGIELPIRWNN